MVAHNFSSLKEIDTRTHTKEIEVEFQKGFKCNLFWKFRFIFFLLRSIEKKIILRVISTYLHFCYSILFYFFSGQTKVEIFIVKHFLLLLSDDKMKQVARKKGQRIYGHEFNKNCHMCINFRFLLRTRIKTKKKQEIM